MNDLGEFQRLQRIGDGRPDDKSITIFVPSAFLKNISSPQFQVELYRRARSSSEIAFVHAARLCAAAEGMNLSGVDELKANGYLPAGFALRPDDSKLIIHDDRIVDSRRGARGTFLPISDIQIKSTVSR